MMEQFRGSIELVSAVCGYFQVLRRRPAGVKGLIFLKINFRKTLIFQLLSADRLRLSLCEHTNTNVPIFTPLAQCHLTDSVFIRRQS